MHRLARAIIASALLSGASLLNAGTMQPILYPETRRDALVEEKFGEKIADPFRWLGTVSYTHLRAHETLLDLVCRLLLEKTKKQKQQHGICAHRRQFIPIHTVYQR